MSVIDRLNRLVRANLNDFFSRGAGGGNLGELKSSLREARAQLIECRAAEKRLAQEYEGLLDEALSWEERAMLALRSGDEELARQALYRKHEVEVRTRSVKSQLDEHRAYMQDLSRSLDAIEVKLEAIREHGRAARTAGVMPAAQPRVDLPERPSQPQKLTELEAEAELGAFKERETFQAFDEMANRINRAEAELDALKELGSASSIGEEPLDEIDARFRELEIKRDLNRLAKRSDAMGNLRKMLDGES